MISVRKIMAFVVPVLLLMGCGHGHKNEGDAVNEYLYYEVYQQNRYSKGETIQNKRTITASSDEAACEIAEALFGVRESVYQGFVDKNNGMHEYIDRPLFYSLSREVDSVFEDGHVEVVRRECQCALEKMELSVGKINREIEEMFEEY